MLVDCGKGYVLQDYFIKILIEIKSVFVYMINFMVINMIYFLSSILKNVFFPFIDIETFDALLKVSKSFKEIIQKEFSSNTIPIIGNAETSRVIAATNLCFTNISLKLSDNSHILYNFPRIKHLSITASNRKRLNSIIFKSLESLNDLVSFELINCNFEYKPKIKKGPMIDYNAGNHFEKIFDSKLKKLEKIKLINCKDVDDRFFKNLEKLTNLKILILESCKAKISENSINDVTRIKKLETLYLCPNTIINEKVLRTSLSNLSHLKYVKYPSGKVEEFIKPGEKP